MKKLVYAFQEGSKEMKPLLGGKGANHYYNRSM